MDLISAVREGEGDYGKPLKELASPKYEGVDIQLKFCYGSFPLVRQCWTLMDPSPFHTTKPYTQ